MSREIEFRVFDKKYKKMYESVLTIHWLYGEELHEIQVDGDDGPVYLDNDASFELMQWTGLKDKHGKKIFEGDVVKTSQLIGTHTIVFKYGCFGFEGNNDASGAFRNRNVGFIAFSETSTEYVEIIGNLYENPDLLEQAK